MQRGATVCCSYGADATRWDIRVTLHAYHEGSFAAFTAFTDVHITIEQQIAEGDRVASSIVTRGTHTGPFFGLPATGKAVTLATMRIERLEGGKIAEHWSTADVAGLMAQIQG